MSVGNQSLNERNITDGSVREDGQSIVNALAAGHANGDAIKQAAYVSALTKAGADRVSADQVRTYLSRHGDTLEMDYRAREIIEPAARKAWDEIVGQGHFSGKQFWNCFSSINLEQPSSNIVGQNQSDRRFGGIRRSVSYYMAVGAKEHYIKTVSDAILADPEGYHTRLVAKLQGMVDIEKKADDIKSLYDDEIEKAVEKKLIPDAEKGRAILHEALQSNYNDSKLYSVTRRFKNSDFKFDGNPESKDDQHYSNSGDLRNFIPLIKSADPTHISALVETAMVAYNQRMFSVADVALDYRAAGEKVSQLTESRAIKQARVDEIGQSGLAGRLLKSFEAATLRTQMATIGFQVGTLEKDIADLREEFESQAKQAGIRIATPEIYLAEISGLQPASPA